MAKKDDKDRDTTKPKSSVTSKTKKDLLTTTTTQDVDFEAGSKDIDTEAILGTIKPPEHEGFRQAQASAINALTYGSPFADMSLPGGAFAPTAEARQIAGGLVGSAIPTVQQAQAGQAPQLFGAGSGLQRADPTQIDYGPQAHTPGQQQFWDKWALQQQDYLSTLAPVDPPLELADSGVLGPAPGAGAPGAGAPGMAGPVPLPSDPIPLPSEERKRRDNAPAF